LSRFPYLPSLNTSPTVNGQNGESAAGPAKAGQADAGEVEDESDDDADDAGAAADGAANGGMFKTEPRLPAACFGISSLTRENGL
jgi:hypothetical protein